MHEMPDQVPIERFRLPPDRPKKAIPAVPPRLRQLAKTAGIAALPPVVYRPSGNGLAGDSGAAELDILAGVGTWQVAQEMRWETVPAIPGPADPDAAWQLIAQTYGDRDPLIQVRQVIEEFDAGKSPPEIARERGMDRTLVWHWLRLRKLIPEAWEAVEAGEISLGHGRILAAQPQEAQATWLHRIRKERLSVHRLRRLMGDESSRDREAPSPAGTGVELDPAVKAAIRDLENRGTEYLGSPLQIRHQPDGSGEIRVKYTDLDVLQGILEKMGAVEPEDW